MIEIEQKILEFEQIYSKGYDKTTEDVCCEIGIDANIFYEWKTNEKYSERLKNFFDIQSIKRFQHLKETALVSLQRKVSPRIETINVLKTSKKPKQSNNQLILLDDTNYNTEIVAIQEETHTREVLPSSTDLRYVIENSERLNSTISLSGGHLDISVLSEDQQLIFVQLLNKVMNHGTEQ